MELPKAGEVLLQKYRLEKLLGEGGMGVVFAAHHELLGQRVAVKLIRPEFSAQGDAVTRFLNEARAAARIENDHVARVLDVGLLDGNLPYMVLEYLDGADLAHVLHQRRVLPVNDVVDYLLETIEAVAHAHAQGIVHRDLKPSNLFLARRPDGTSRVKVLDFGISKALGSTPGTPANVTRTNAMLGSPLYMSPEQLRDSKAVDQRCDIWALGVICYELLAGRPPFNADNAVALFAAIMESAPPSLAAIRHDAAALEPIVMRCLRNRVDERFASVTELGEALAPFGTAVAARALENAKRILPPSSARAVDAVSTVALQSSSPHHASGRLATGPVGSATPYGPQHAPVVASTADPWASSQPTIPRPKSAGGVVVAVSLAVVAILGGAGVVASRMWAKRANDLDARASAAGSASAPPAVAASSEPVAESASVASPPPPPPSASAEASSSAAAARESTTKPVAVATKHAEPVKPAANASPVKTPANTAAAPTQSASTAVNCNPPFYYDASGKKIWKRECD